MVRAIIEFVVIFSIYIKIKLYGTVLNLSIKLSIKLYFILLKLWIVREDIL